MQVRLSDGQLEEVEPGAGRVFGLMSIVALPRRLSFDERRGDCRRLAPRRDVLPDAEALHRGPHAGGRQVNAMLASGRCPPDAGAIVPFRGYSAGHLLGCTAAQKR